MSSPDRPWARVPRAISYLLAVVVTAGGAWWAALHFESPQQRAATAAPPSAVPVLVDVQWGRLSEQITAQATVTASESRRVDLTLPGSGYTPVVTKVHVTTGSLSQAAPVLAINSRPVFSISGSFAMWRDLSSGMKGDDVSRLQMALKDAGYEIRDSELGTFGSGTMNAVKLMYKSAGYHMVDAADSSGSASPEIPAEASPPRDAESLLTVPASEILVVPGALPARVTDVPSVGTNLTSESAYLSLVGGLTVARADIPDAVLVRIDTDDVGVLEVGEEPGIDVKVYELVPADDVTTAAPHIVVAAVEGQVIPDSWSGRDALLTLTLTAVPVESLLVPTRAVAVQADGSSVVLKVNPDGSVERVPVDVIGELGGVSAVRPSSESDLTIEDQVEVA